MLLDRRDPVCVGVCLCLGQAQPMGSSAAHPGGMPGALTWVHATFWLAPGDVSPTGDNVVAGLVLVVLTMIAR